jgi:hypothetical protein
MHVRLQEDRQGAKSTSLEEQTPEVINIKAAGYSAILDLRALNVSIHAEISTLEAHDAL